MIYDESESAITKKTYNYEIWKKFFVFEEGKYRIYGSNMPNHNRFKPYLDRFRKKLGRSPKNSDIVYELTGPRLGTVQFIKIPVGNSSNPIEFPTQKPLELYRRIILVSSIPQDIVFVPFCSCTTAFVAAEIENRKWVGIGQWENAQKIIDEGLKDIDSYAFLGKYKTNQELKVVICNTFPSRTDEGTDLESTLTQSINGLENEQDAVESKSVMKSKQVLKFGLKCQGCNRIFDHEEYLELNHNIPRNLGGNNHICNRTLLCLPCQKRKKNMLSLEELQSENSELGLMNCI